MNKDLKLTDIIAPDLLSSTYGDDINEKFRNIDDNFTKLENNADLYRGPMGESIVIEQVKLTKYDTNVNPIGYKLYSALRAKLEEEYPSLETSINQVNWDDKISDYVVELSKLTNSYTSDKNNINPDIDPSLPESPEYGEGVESMSLEEPADDVYVGSVVPLLFIDYRFDKNTISSVSSLDVYKDVIDCTCIVVFKYENDDWKCYINKSFPTLKYEDESFYWTLGETSSSIKATGIKGEKGQDAKVWLCYGSVYKGNYNQYISEKYITPSGSTGIFKAGVGSVGDTAIIFTTNSGDEPYNGFYISSLYKQERDGSWIINKSPNIQHINFEKNTIEFFKTLGRTGDVEAANPAKGMFLLFDPNDTNSKNKKSHMLYSDHNDTTDTLVVAPVESYKNPQTISGDETISLKIDYDNTYTNNLNSTNITADSLYVNGDHDSADGKIKVSTIIDTNSENEKLQIDCIGEYLDKTHVHYGFKKHNKLELCQNNTKLSSTHAVQSGIKNAYITTNIPEDDNIEKNTVELISEFGMSSNMKQTKLTVTPTRVTTNSPVTCDGVATNNSINYILVSKYPTDAYLEELTKYNLNTDKLIAWETVRKSDNKVRFKVTIDIPENTTSEIFILNTISDFGALKEAYENSGITNMEDLSNYYPEIHINFKKDEIENNRQYNIWCHNEVISGTGQKPAIYFNDELLENQFGGSNKNDGLITVYKRTRTIKGIEYKFPIYYNFQLTSFKLL